ncbi:nuclear transport factor 2 family protein [Bradyrhizobium sp. CCGUVB1N3]|uniref:nuclear transport factor 2 family protein n=1 Tax=Bradyrhizobium sp. CCGUVB1N3 TaxID=2949629 RepID=UPI0020B43A1E|nr:nuclear transport factor 2 family protein [Bradyrhizobium sp. CCGUVB1N3]MCP3476071.1 nuclear transport factor 2 family protein [Bradyrhizobium sp. CCGUVB1N3]
MNHDQTMLDVRAFLELWAQTFNSHRLEHLVALYADDALLHGTSSSTLYIGVEEIRTYFHDGAMAKFDVWYSVRLAVDVVMVIGKYAFSEMRHGQHVTTPARFTFVLRRHDGAWKILHHHSSATPI